MYLTFSDYTTLGYAAVTNADFLRYEAMARKLVDKYCFNRVTSENITDDNRRGMCEIIDIYNNDENQLNIPVVSFSNEGYSETKAISLVAHQKTATEKAVDIINLYFTASQLYRGV